LLALAERWAEMEPRLRQAPSEGGRQGLEPEALAPPPVLVSDPNTDVAFSSFSGFTQSETSTARCGDTVVVGFNDTGSIFESLFFGPAGGASMGWPARRVPAPPSRTWAF
jgi:hypothetical protein